MYQGDYLKKYLEDRGISAAKFAHMLNKSRQTVYQYFDSKNLSRETVNKILTALNAEEREVFTDLPPADVVLQTKDNQILFMEAKTFPFLSQGETFRKYAQQNTLNNTVIAKALNISAEQVGKIFHLKKFSDELLKLIAAAYPDFQPIDQSAIPNSNSFAQPELIKDKIIENLLEQVNELKEKLAHYETGGKQKHA